MLAVELARARVGRSVLDGVIQIFQRDIAARHGRWIRFDPHRRLRAVNSNLADARQNAQALAHLRIGVIVELPFGHRVADQRHIDRLIVGICFRERRRAGQVDGKLSLGARDRGLHICRGGVEALGQIKLQNEAGVPLAVVGRHHFQARESA